MRRPSSRIAKNLVTIQATTFVQDGDAGRVLTPTGAPSGLIACRVHPASSDDVPAHMREEGVVYYTIHFFGSAPPPVKIRYLVTWLDVTPNQVLSVTGPAYTAAGERATWLVPCEYRVPPQPGLA